MDHAILSTCIVCLCGKSSHQTTVGLDKHSTKHGHSTPYQGNTVILGIVHCFIKAADFLALFKIPTAHNIASLLVDHVFHGIPTDIVSVQGP